MDFAFYNADPQGGRAPWLLKPFRRIGRRILRPYFHALRDLLSALHRRDNALAEGHHRLAERLAEAEARNAVFLIDYLAMARRLARVEDLLIQARADAIPTAPERPRKSAA